MITIESMKMNLNQIFDSEKLSKWELKYPVFVNNDVKNWICNMISQYSRNGKDASKFSIVSYLNELQKFCDFHECSNPSDLLSENIDSRNTRVSKYLETLIKDGRNEVSVKNCSQSYVKSFYSNRGSNVSYQLKCEKSGLNTSEIILNQDKIRILENKLTNPSYVLLLKMQSQLGLRISDCLEEITSVKYKIEKYKDHFYIRNFTSQKECVKINFLFMPHELSDLIRSSTGIDDLTKLDLSKLFKSKYKDSESKIDSGNYLRRLKEIAEELGWKDNIKTHTFRTWFRSQVKRSGIDIEFMEHLVGHEAQNLADAYNQDLKDISWYYENWLIVEPFILIDGEVINKTDEEVLDLKEKLMKTEARLDLMVQNKIKQDEKIEMIQKLNLDNFEQSMKERDQKIDDLTDKLNAISSVVFKFEEIQNENALLKSTLAKLSKLKDLNSK